MQYRQFSVEFRPPQTPPQEVNVAQDRGGQDLSLRVSDDVVFRLLEDEAVILNLASGVYFGLNPVGTRMWQLLTEHDSIDVVVEALLGEFEVDEDRLRRDLDSLIGQLVEKGLVTNDTATTPPSQ